MKSIEILVKEYNIRIDGDNIRVNKRIGENRDDMAFVKAHKAEIIKYINGEKQKKEAAMIEREKKIVEIDGLNEIMNAMDDIKKWNMEFEHSFNYVGGFGVRKKPKYDFDALNAKHPKAAAYIKANDYYKSGHYAKAAAGRKAIEKIINGDDFHEAIESMEKEWIQYCDEHIFD